MEELLTVAEVARMLRVDATTIRRWVKTGVLEAVTLPHRGKRQAYRIKRRTVDAILSPHVSVENQLLHDTGQAATVAARERLP